MEGIIKRFFASTNDDKKFFYMFLSTFYMLQKFYDIGHRPTVEIKIIWKHDKKSQKLQYTI